MNDTRILLKKTLVFVSHLQILIHLMFEVEITNIKGNTNQTTIQSWPPRPHEDLREVIILP